MRRSPGSRQSCAGPEPLTLNKSHYGGLGLRGNRRWFDPANRNKKEVRDDFYSFARSPQADDVPALVDSDESRTCNLGVRPESLFVVAVPKLGKLEEQTKEVRKVSTRTAEREPDKSAGRSSDVASSYRCTYSS